MSKVDALRAMREAKYARAGAPPLPPGAVAPKGAVRPAPRVPADRVQAPAPAATGQESAVADTDERCGHRNMGGKSCSRPAGHSEKNHRYATS